jgi:hypothetical protein
MTSPMPWLAPVTKVIFPLRSNMGLPRLKKQSTKGGSHPVTDRAPASERGETIATAGRGRGQSVMLRKIHPLVWFASCALALAPAAAPAPKAEPLRTFSITVKPGSFLHLHGGRSIAATDAATRKADLDFVYLASREGGYVKREFFNLSGKDTQLPADVLGTRAGIVALGWDDDLVAKCQTTADLKRMTGSYTANSFSFAATVSNNRSGELDGKRFIFLDAKGRMGFFSVKAGAGDELVLDGKIEP